MKDKETKRSKITQNMDKFINSLEYGKYYSIKEIRDITQLKNKNIEKLLVHMEGMGLIERKFGLTKFGLDFMDLSSEKG